MDTNFVSNDTYMVKAIQAKDARDIVKKYHYSGKVVASSKIHLGIFNTEGMLVGCLQFGPPMNGEKTAKKVCNDTRMLELNRMATRDEEPRNSESMAISLCIKYLKKYTDIQWLLSFSDGKESNVGYIYQATNWQYLGYMLSGSFYKLDGKYVHNVNVWHRYKEKHPDRDVKTTDQILFDNFNDVRKVECKQHIYVFPLNKKCKFLFSQKKYPKLETETPIIREFILKDSGVVLDKKMVIKHTDEEICSIF